MMNIRPIKCEKCGKELSLFEGNICLECEEKAIQALEQEQNREFEDYENEIEDLHNRLDIAEYDKERLREEVTNLEAKIKALEQQSCSDVVSRQAAIDAVKKNTFRLTFAEEQGCEGHVAWSAEAVYSDVIEGALLELPPVTPQQMMGHWITTRTFMHDGEFYCDKCKCESPNNEKWNYCPNCGNPKMQEVEK